MVRYTRDVLIWYDTCILAFAGHFGMSRQGELTDLAVQVFRNWSTNLILVVMDLMEIWIREFHYLNLLKVIHVHVYIYQNDDHWQKKTKCLTFLVVVAFVFVSIIYQDDACLLFFFWGGGTTGEGFTDTSTHLKIKELKKNRHVVKLNWTDRQPFHVYMNILPYILCTYLKILMPMIHTSQYIIISGNNYSLVHRYCRSYAHNWEQNSTPSLSTALNFISWWLYCRPVCSHLV